MNKIYMTKRGHDGKTVVCSEKTRARGKMKSLALAITTVIGVAGGELAHATTTLGDNQIISDTTSVAIGENVVATGADTVAVGDYTKATGDESTVIGKRATGFGDQSTATGSYAFADGNQSTSNGHASSAMATDTIAIGVNSGAAGGSMSKEDWDKLLIIDREIKELDPNSFTKTVTTPGTTPDRTPVDEAKSVLDEALNDSMQRIAFIASPIPSQMYTGLPGDDLDDSLRNATKAINPTTLVGDIANAYDALIGTSNGNLGSATSRENDELLTKFSDIDSLLKIAKEVGIVTGSDPADIIYGSAYELSTDGGLNLYYWDTMFNINMASTMSDVENQYIEAQKALASYEANQGKTGQQVYQEAIDTQFKNFLSTLSDEVKTDALSALNNGLSQALIDKYENSANKQDFVKAMTASAYAKTSALTKELFNDNAAWYPDSLKDEFDLSSTSIFEAPLFKHISTNERLFNKTPYKSSLYPEAPEGIEGVRYTIEKQYEKAKAIIQARQDAQAAYDKALAEYEAAVAAGGTGGTTTTTTDLAAYEAALAEKRAELTKLANAAGFDGTFESLSDVFGSKAGRAIAIGNSAYVSGDESVGVGYGNKVTGNQANVFGTHNTVTGDNNNVVGNNNTVATAGNNILGNAVTFAAGVATVGNVALGNDSVIGAAVPTKSVDIRGTTYDFAGTNPTSVVTVGSAGNERQITNVAAGQVTATSTDAINGSQLYAVVKAVEELEAGSADTNTDKSVRVNGSELVSVTSTAGAADGITTMTDYSISLSDKVATKDFVTEEIAKIQLPVDTDTNSISKVEQGKGVTVTSVVDTNTTTFTVSVDDTIADKQYVADEIAKIPVVTDTNTDKSVRVKSDSNLLSVTSAAGAADGITTMTDYTITLSDKVATTDYVDGEIAKIPTIKAGDNIAVKQDTVDGKPVVVVSADKSTVSQGDGVTVAVTETPTANGAVNRDYKVSLDDATKAQLAKEESVSAGSNIVVKQDKVNSTGGKNYNVSLASDLTGISSISNGDTTVKLGDGAVNVGGATITNVASPVNATDAVNKAYVDNSKTTVSKGDGITVTQTTKVVDGATSIDYNVALDDATKATLSQVQVNKDAIAKGINTTADDGKVTKHPLGGIVAVLGDGNNIKTVTTDTGAISVQMADNLKVNSVVIEGSSVGMGAGGISAGGNKIYNVAPGTLSPSSMDAVNGSQLYATNVNVANNAQNIGMLKERMDEFDDALDAQAAGARAALGIPQVTLPGKSMVGVGLGNYGDAQALAVGFSRLSDNARTILKGSIDANTKDTNKFGVSLGLGYQW